MARTWVRGVEEEGWQKRGRREKKKSMCQVRGAIAAPRESVYCCVLLLLLLLLNNLSR